ncbi:polysaccharide biosynthesis protein [Pigmentiphaga sp. GD03639]|uniref:polysaccharide biosynthesis protein n=1 Tax=Pigmentiphaga sp. GD03639 TaxID=2975354 RepID=UPI00244ADCAC|nr:nucleoside-diphosphate sugar epimerase/dehydratase [Pigmentiphaga sp. GD03639]MDH2239842.1 polysaccharide biosynthesis protein [Pigmentiphaga sp. GD03639]
MLTKLRNILLSFSRPQKIAVMVIADAIALPASLIAAFYLRLGDAIILQKYGISAPVIMALAAIPVFYFCGLYRTVVRYMDISMLRSTGIGLAIIAIGTYAGCLLFDLPTPPRSSLLIYWFIAFSYVVISRFGARNLLRTPLRKHLKAPRVAVYGAGEAGFQLVNAMRTSHAYAPICFFDDDTRLANKHVAGLRVYPLSRLDEVLHKHEIQQIVLAIPSASPQRRRTIVNRLSHLSIPVRTLPTMAEMVEGKILESAIREVQVEDLLGRKPVPPRSDLFSKCVTGKSVLVTGAGGSIGSELCRQIESQQPSQLILLDHSEYALYAIEHELKERFPDIELYAYMGSVCDISQLSQIVREHQVNTIYHAAAYKHVPLVENNMAAGIRNNVLGTWAVALTAAQNNIETCVLISTDKAVRPPNVMGATKRCAELIFQAFSLRPNNRTTFSMVRFGNVLGSSGSVVPLFRNQIQRGGPITVTHEDVTRYFMLIPEAAQLVIQAGAMAQGGEVFVLDMGDPVRIIDLARTMVEMSGLAVKDTDNPNGDIEIQVVGLRPGEKLYEELLIGGDTIPSEHPRILCSREHYLTLDQLEPMLEQLRIACTNGSSLDIRIALQRLVPEYTPYSLLSARSLPKTVESPILAKGEGLVSTAQNWKTERETAVGHAA